MAPEPHPGQYAGWLRTNRWQHGEQVWCSSSGSKEGWLDCKVGPHAADKARDLDIVDALNQGDQHGVCSLYY
jgi:hypothetical protein